MMRSSTLIIIQNSTVLFQGIQMEAPTWVIPFDEDEEDEDYTGVTSEHVWKSTKNKKLPYVFIYLGWTICCLSVVVSAFFTFMYSLQWGGEKANKWLSAFILSAGENICVLSTAQVRLCYKRNSAELLKLHEYPSLSCYEQMQLASGDMSIDQFC